MNLNLWKLRNGDYFAAESPEHAHQLARELYGPTAEVGTVDQVELVPPGAEIRVNFEDGRGPINYAAWRAVREFGGAAGYRFGPEH